MGMKELAHWAPLLADGSRIFFLRGHTVKSHKKALSSKVTKRVPLHYVITLPCDFPEQKVQGKKQKSGNQEISGNFIFFLPLHSILKGREKRGGLHLCVETLLT